MVKLYLSMTTQVTQTKPKPPSLVSSLLGGFDSIANHISIILFPIALDTFLWLGPRLRVKQLIQQMLDQFSNLPGTTSPNMTTMLALSREIWGIIAQRANLLVVLRTYPIGIPSLMSARMPIETPLGQPMGWEMSSTQLMLLWFLLTLLGLSLGCLYFSLTAQAALNNRVDWRSSLQEWPWTFQQVIWLTVFLLLLLFIMSIPVGFILFIIALIGSWISQIVLLLLSGLMVWLLLPLLFSAHGIFVYRQKMFTSFFQGLQLTRFTLPKTSLYFLTVFIISQGLDLLWQVPPENSWLALVGICGHAFVSSSLLASSFIYYKQSNSWLGQLNYRLAMATASNQSQEN